MTRPRQQSQREKDQPNLKIVRCAVYTRKSTEHGLEQEFNSLDAQREACESFIASQRHEGWTCLSESYDDGGFTGANIDRPALRRLLVDIEQGKVDQVVCYKLDRLSRSLLDFAGLMRTFEDRGVGFTSVTQQFSTNTSMGRLVLNVLLSFAQFEREIIGERTRDKIAATRRRGRWTGGQPLLGYDLDPTRTKLVVNETEAEQVRGIFALYLERGCLLGVVRELARRGWVSKRWTTLKGQERGGHTFTKTMVHRMLKNISYLGLTRYREEQHQGLHEAIIDQQTFARVQATLASNDANGGDLIRGESGALLQGLLTCGACGCGMTPSFTTKGDKRYRYYRCSTTLQRGKEACANGSVPAGQLEAVVLDRLKALGRDEHLRAEVLAHARQQAEARTQELAAEERSLEKDLAAWSRDLLKLSAQLRPGADNGDVVTRLADLQARIGQVEDRCRKVKQQVSQAHRSVLDEDDAADALAAFDPAWQAMTPREQARVVALLVEQVTYDGVQGKLTVTFAPSGIKTLAEELAGRQQQHQQGQRDQRA